MGTQQRLWAGMLVWVCTSATARPPHHPHHSEHPAAAASSARALSATPVVARDYGKTQADAMDSGSHLVPTADALIQSEEELDRLRLEHDDLLSRVQSLQQQLRDEQLLLKLKQQQIRELEARLRAQNHS